MRRQRGMYTHASPRPKGDASPDGMTCEQIGKVLGLTRHQVRFIELSAMKKLRAAAAKMSGDDR